MIVLKDSKVIHEGLSGEMHFALGVAAALKHRLFGVNTVITALGDHVHLEFDPKPGEHFWHTLP